MWHINLVSFRQIHDTVYQVSGPDISNERDCASYLIDFEEPVLIDCGSGFAHNRVVANIRECGYNPAEIRTMVLTHCHVDHIGGAHLFKSQFGTSFMMHALDAAIVQRADQLLTAAFCFNIVFQPLAINTVLTQDPQTLRFGNHELIAVHTPGHTPGSISLYLDLGGTRIVFAQDIAAPLLKDFHCDPAAWTKSIDKLITLEADILCDGHTGAFQPKRNVRRYLETCVRAQAQQGYLK